MIYLPIYIGCFFGFHAGEYTSPMDPIWERLPKKTSLNFNITNITDRDVTESGEVIRRGAEEMNEEKGSGQGFLLGVAEMN